MSTVSLNGKWNYRIGNGKFSSTNVPFSRLPVGHSECVRYFDITESNDHIFLKFDGITYYATVFLNGEFIGEMLPYCEYEFEITEKALPKNNELKVILEDINRAFGPSEGWENFGGIIRDVNLIYRDECYIKDVFFKSTLSEDHKSAEIEVIVNSVNNSDVLTYINISRGGNVLCSYTQPTGKELKTHVTDIELWSPDSPNLYTLEVRLVKDDHQYDLYTCSVGFRSITHDGHRFIINGKPLFLKGVCKHEMVVDSGHCPTLQQIESDMTMIKSMGCNFVRLVHYPHNKKTLDIADRLGLFVSEEPGLWWSDTSNKEIADSSKEVLRRTIIRDRNHPSIAFWLCFNECKFTESFLYESAAVCRENDPTRMVSGANCMSDEETLHYYNKCGFDFYTMHPYSDTFERALQSSRILCDKPLLFTEWGGYYLYDKPHLLMDFMESMNELYKKGSLAGAFFWFFAELNDFNRGAPACIDGVLREGLVDKFRKPTLIFKTFCDGLKLFDRDESSDCGLFGYEKCEAFDDMSSYKQLKTSYITDFDKLHSIIQKEAESSGYARKRQITYGPVLPTKTPYLLCTQEPITFDCCENCKSLSILGLTSIINGYPLGGEYGQAVCKIIIEYSDGSTQTLELKNGVHITTVFALKCSSRIDPIAEESKRFAMFHYDKNFEYYVINRMDIPINPDKKLQRVTFSTDRNDYAVLLYGVFVK